MFIVNVEGAIYKDDRYLMIVRSEKEAHAGGTLSMVGGKVDGLESGANRDAILEATLRREIAEEVGVQVGDEMIYVESKAFTADDNIPVIDIVFLCAYKSGESTAIDPDEVESLHWMTAQEIYAHPKTPIWIQQSIQKVEIRRLQALNQHSS